MPSDQVQGAILGRIADLARQAAAEPNLSPVVRSRLDAILKLASDPSADTPEPSDMPQTENQSL